MSQFTYTPGTPSSGQTGAPDLAQAHFEQTMQKLEKINAQVDAIKNEMVRLTNDMEQLKRSLPPR